MASLIGIAVIVLFYLLCVGAIRLLTPRLFRRRVNYRGFVTVTVFAIIVCI